MVPALGAGEAQSESDHSRIQRSALPAEVAARAGHERIELARIGRRARQFADEKRWSARALLVVRADEEPARGATSARSRCP